MKKILVLLVFCVLLLSSCTENGKYAIAPEGAENSVSENSLKDDNYSYMHADWTVYNSPKELVDSAHTIFIAKVTGISFKMLDCTTGLSPSKNTKDWHIELRTFYEVDILTSYKGSLSGSAKIRMYACQTCAKPIRVEERSYCQYTF